MISSCGVRGLLLILLRALSSYCVLLLLLVPAAVWRWRVHDACDAREQKMSAEKWSTRGGGQEETREEKEA